jgi:hypothetical protein
MWVTKDEKEQERKRREDRQTKQLINALFGGMGVMQPPYQARPQTQGNYQPRPYQGGNQGGHRGGNYNRGGGRGGQRGGGYRNQNQQSQSGVRPVQQPQPQPAAQIPVFPLPPVNPADLANIPNAENRKTFVGNAIYGIIEQTFGSLFAGRITGMLIDEAVINFTTLLSDPSYFTTKAHEAYQLLL